MIKTSIYQTLLYKLLITRQELQMISAVWIINNDPFAFWVGALFSFFQHVLFIPETISFVGFVALYLHSYLLHVAHVISYVDGKIAK